MIESQWYISIAQNTRYFMSSATYPIIFSIGSTDGIN